MPSHIFSTHLFKVSCVLKSLYVRPAECRSYGTRQLGSSVTLQSYRFLSLSLKTTWDCLSGEADGGRGDLPPRDRVQVSQPTRVAPHHARFKPTPRPHSALRQRASLQLNFERSALHETLGTIHRERENARARVRLGSLQLLHREPIRLNSKRPLPTRERERPLRSPRGERRRDRL